MRVAMLIAVLGLLAGSAGRPSSWVKGLPAGAVTIAGGVLNIG